MQERGPISFPQGIAKIVTRTDLQGCGAWPRAFLDKCKDHRFYEIVEQTLAQDFEYRYLLLEDESGEVRAIQPVFFCSAKSGGGRAWQIPIDCRSCSEKIPALFNDAGPDGRMRGGRRPSRRMSPGR